MVPTLHWVSLELTRAVCPSSKCWYILYDPSYTQTCTQTWLFPTPTMSLGSLWILTGWWGLFFRWLDHSVPTTHWQVLDQRVMNQSMVSYSSESSSMISDSPTSHTFQFPYNQAKFTPGEVTLGVSYQNNQCRDTETTVYEGIERVYVTHHLSL